MVIWTFYAPFKMLTLHQGDELPGHLWQRGLAEDVRFLALPPEQIPPRNQSHISIF